MKKKLLFAIISIILIFSTLIFIACDGEVENVDTDHDLTHDDLGIAPDSAAIAGTDAPDASKLNATSEELSEQADVKEAAVYLFNLANDNLSKVAYYANYAYGSGIASVTTMKMTGSMEVREVRIKDGAAMYMVTMGRVVNGYNNDTPDKTNSLVLSACRLLLDYGNRKFTPDGKTFYVQEGGTSSLASGALNNFYTENAYIDWNKCDKVESMSTADFMKKDYYNKSYVETTNATISADTIVNASIAHNAAGYYEIEITVDVTTDALKLSTESTRESANSDDIVYAYQTIKCQIWDCGLFRQYETFDSWEGSFGAGPFHLGGYSKNEWHKTFTYNKQNAPLYQIPTDTSWAK